MNTRKKQHVVAARTLLSRAIEIDPKCAPAYSLLSFIGTLGVHLGWYSRKETPTTPLRFARKALALDDEEPWAHLALGYATLQIRNSPQQAIEVLNDALKLNPGLAVAHYLIALACTYTGDTEKAFRHADIAEAFDPRDLLARGNAGAYDNVRATASFIAGRYRNGIEFARKAIDQSPLQTPAYRQIVLNGALSGEIAEAKLALQSVKRLAPNVQRWLAESEAMWAHQQNYRRYLEAFRMVGFR
jgi:tetratricopeptide (TPR) repeat protein